MDGYSFALRRRSLLNLTENPDEFMDFSIAEQAGDPQGIKIRKGQLVQHEDRPSDLLRSAQGQDGWPAHDDQSEKPARSVPARTRSAPGTRRSSVGDQSKRPQCEHRSFGHGSCRLPGWWGWLTQPGLRQGR